MYIKYKISKNVSVPINQLLLKMSNYVQFALAPFFTILSLICVFLSCLILFSSLSYSSIVSEQRDILLLLLNTYIVILHLNRLRMFRYLSPSIVAARLTAVRVCFRGRKITGPKWRNTCCQTCLRLKRRARKVVWSDSPGVGRLRGGI